jgi:group I intron endonuclease
MENLTYEEFINNILNTRGRFACGDTYHECHHIIPRCIDGTDDKENLIDLFAREHFIAHKLLADENPDNNKLIYAWACMAWVKNECTNERYETTPEEYEEAKIAFAKMLSETRSGENGTFYGKCHTEETKQKISKSHMGMTASDETREKLSELAIARFSNPENNPMYGKTHTIETKQKISECAKLRVKGLNPNAKKIIRIIDLKIYNCLLDAAEDNKMCRMTMTKKCKKKKDFMYYDEWLKLQNKLEVTNELQTI